ncbi:alpha/beta hydrolase [Rariglobus hedericola]|uniref:Alpha/beta hydrolase n=1 Tax=Rariglobus hedericola TaxID=2597822 RepID=A0A556QNT3_9BACT|nr:alpha/beta hydrolase [Rariglobus hedericola]TSJ78310.1 alpha/beta hydrolase [Rariglobus hedericola]
MTAAPSIHVRFLKSLVRSLSIVFVLTLLLFLAGLTPPAHAMLEGKLLYFPSHEPNRSALTEWKVDGALAGYARLVAQPRAIWLITHGNGGQAADRTYIIDNLPADTSVYVLEYPGYGLRPGKPSMKSINAAALSAYEALRALHPGLPLNVFGESLGSGPASYLCSLPVPPDALVLAVPYDNLLSVAKESISFLPVGLLMRDKWDNVKTLSAYKNPVTIFGALHDTIIRVTHARALAKTIPHVRYIELPCGHNEWSLSPQVRITD